MFVVGTMGEWRSYIVHQASHRCEDMKKVSYEDEPTKWMLLKMTPKVFLCHIVVYISTTILLAVYMCDSHLKTHIAWRRGRGHAFSTKGLLVVVISKIFKISWNNDIAKKDKEWNEPPLFVLLINRYFREGQVFGDKPIRIPLFRPSTKVVHARAHNKLRLCRLACSKTDGKL